MDNTEWVVLLIEVGVIALAALLRILGYGRARTP